MALALLIAVLGLLFVALSFVPIIVARRRDEQARRAAVLEAHLQAEAWRTAAGGCTYPECVCPVPCSAMGAMRD